MWSWSSWRRWNNGSISLLGYWNETRGSIVQRVTTSPRASGQEASEAIENATETVWNLPANFWARMHSNGHWNLERSTEPKHRLNGDLREKGRWAISPHSFIAKQLWKTHHGQIRGELTTWQIWCSTRRASYWRNLDKDADTEYFISQSERCVHPTCSNFNERVRHGSDVKPQVR